MVLFCVQGGPRFRVGLLFILILNDPKLVEPFGGGSREEPVDTLGLNDAEKGPWIPTGDDKQIC